MTWQDPGGDPAPGGPGGPDDDATRAEWDLARLDALVGNGGGGTGSNAGQPAGPGSELPPPPDAGASPATPPGPPAGPPPAPPVQPPWSGGDPSGAPPVSPGYGYPTPGYPPAAGAGMAWAPPPSYGGPSGPGTGLEYAGVGGRFVAWVLDGVLLNIVGAVISWVLFLILIGTGDWSSFFLRAGTSTGGTYLDPAFFGRVLVVSIVITVLTTGINLAYFVLQWSSTARATLGMRLLGLEIGSAADGRTLDRGQALRRWLAMGEWANLVAVIPAIGGLVTLVQLLWYLILMITTANNPQRRGLHDQYAGTAVVQPAGRSNSGLVIGCIVLVVLVVIVIPLVSIVALIFLGGQVSSILSTVGESI